MKLTKETIPFGMVPNALLNDSLLSFKAKGLFAFIQSKPDGWFFSVERIAGQSKEAKTSVSEGLKELEKFGYLVREKRQTGKGFVTDYKLYLKPILTNPITENQSLENQSLENPTTENPIIGKSVNISKKEYSNKEYSNKEKREGNSLSFFQENFPTRFETVMMQYKKQITDFSRFSESFEATVMQERLEYDGDVIEGRFRKYAISWIHNQNKFDKPVIDLNATQKTEKVGGF